jgi:hypothetical protein
MASKWRRQAGETTAAAGVSAMGLMVPSRSVMRPKGRSRGRGRRGEGSVRKRGISFWIGKPPAVPGFDVTNPGLLNAPQKQRQQLLLYP